MRKFMTRLRDDETGATAIEYGLLAALIAVALITVLGTVGDELVATFDRVAVDLGEANEAE